MLRCLHAGIAPISVRLKNTEHQKVLELPEKWKGNCQMKGLGISTTPLNQAVYKGMHT